MMCDRGRVATALSRELEAAARELGMAAGPEGASEAAARLLGLALRKLELEAVGMRPGAAVEGGSAGAALAGAACSWVGIH